MRNIFAGPIILEPPSTLKGIARHKAYYSLFVYLFIYLFIVYLFIYFLAIHSGLGTHGIVKDKKTNCGGVSKDGKLAKPNASHCGHFAFFEMPTRLLWSERPHKISVTCCKCGTNFKAARHMCKYSLKKSEGLYDTAYLIGYEGFLFIHNRVLHRFWDGLMVGARRMRVYRGR